MSPLESRDRRRFLLSAAAGTIVTAFGAKFVLAGDDDPRVKEKRADGRPRLPPGQKLIAALKPMGGDPGDPSPSAFKLKVHGAVENPFEVDFDGLLGLPQTTMKVDVHCVTGWSCFDVPMTGVLVADLAKKAGVKDSAKHVIFEAAEGYTANVPLGEATAGNVMIAHKLFGKSIPRKHGAPVRGMVPDLYFWKSAKWVQGVKFVTKDAPGFWETRGYHNHADPWKEERYG